MSGASWNHNVISVNIIASLKAKLTGRNCRPYGSDMRIHLPENSLFTYPDVTVGCDKPQFLDKEFDTLLNPIVIMEVLSPSTSDYDSGRKFTLYRSIPTLKEYVLVSSMEYRLQQFTRTNESSWLMHEFVANDGNLELSSLAISLPINEIFEGLDFK
jgi:Uma2 family endonuclease